MFSRVLTVGVIYLLPTILAAQIVQRSNLPMPSSAHNYPLSNVDSHSVHIDSKKFYNQKFSHNKLPMLVGFSSSVGINTSSKGSIIYWPTNEVSWILKIHPDNAPAAALVFSNLSIPNNAVIFVYSEANPMAYYTINSKDCSEGFATTPPFESGPIVVEYVEKSRSDSAKLLGSFDISEIFHFYDGVSDLTTPKGLGDASTCNVNINCSPEGDDWQNQKRGVAKMILKVGVNLYVCSGSLVNNTKQDGKPYFLTAEHCGGGASESDRSLWQFYFNYERAGCSNTGTPPNNMITGSTLLAIGALEGGSDFQLLELSQKPPELWRPYYNGWDRTTVGSQSGVSIHHPEGDAKKISTYNTPLVTSTPTIDDYRMADESAWRVIWGETDNGFGVTQGGSSGSPIFNSDGLLLGTLSGGSSSCGDPNFPDYYGKFNFHWQSNGTTISNQLKPWLDPDNTNASFLSGYDPSGDLYANFKSSKFVLQVGEPILFTDLSTGDDITTWQWSFGEGAQPPTASTKGPHEVTYTSGGPKTVSLTINGSETNTKENYIRVQEIPANAVLFEGFEGDVFPPTGWSNIDKDGDKYKWYGYSINGTAFSGQKSAASSSWYENIGALTPDNWLITPPIEITHNNFLLEYYVGAQDPVYPHDKYGVFISNQSNDPSHFNMVFEETLQNGEWHQRQIDLHDYLGDIIYIAFRHFDCTDWFNVKLDDVLVVGGGDQPSDQARIHSIDITEGGVLYSEISSIENNEASILIEVEEDANIISLAPVVVISQGATIDYTSGTTMDFSNTVYFQVTSESGLVTNTYTVNLVYATKHLVQFNVFNSSYAPITGAQINIENVDEPQSTNEEGRTSVELYRGAYSYTVIANDFEEFSNSFHVADQSIDVNVRMVNTSSPTLYIKDIVVYPNPFTNNLHFKGLGLIGHITITNILGEVVITHNVNGLNEVVIATTKLPYGIYIVTFIDFNSNSIARRVIKR